MNAPILRRRLPHAPSHLPGAAVALGLLVSTLALAPRASADDVVRPPRAAPAAFDAPAAGLARGGVLDLPERVAPTSARTAFAPSDETDAARAVRDASRRAMDLPPAAPGKLLITLRDAIYRALESNVDIKVSRVDALAAQESLPVAQAAFDPALAFNLTKGQNRAPFFSNNPFSGLPPGLQVAQSDFLNTSTTLSKRFVTGTELSLGLNTQRTRSENVFSLNPEYRGSIDVTFRQPLLKGISISANTADIDLAALEAEIARERLHRQLLDSLWDVELAYWDLVFAIEDLRVRQISLDVAKTLLVRAQKTFEAGTVDKVQVYIAEAGVAIREEAIINARSAILAARDRLVRLMMPSLENADWDIDIVPVDGVPEVIKADDPDVTACVREALEVRPEVNIALLDIRSKERLLDRAENDALPQVDFTATWTQRGLGTNSDQVFDGIGSGRFYDFTFGLDVQMPLFLRAERARARRASLDLRSSTLQRANAEYLVIEDVRRAAREIKTTRERIQATTKSLESARRQLDQIRKKFDVGLAATFEVFELEEDYAEAELSWIRARIDHHIAIMALERAKAVFLDYYSVTVH